MIPFGIFGTLFQAVFTSGLTINDIETVIKDGVALVELVAAGKYSDALTALRADLSDELPIFEKVGSILFPNLPVTNAIETLANLLTGSHKMPPEIEQNTIAAAQAGSA